MHRNQLLVCKQMHEDICLFASKCMSDNCLSGSKCMKDNSLYATQYIIYDGFFDFDNADNSVPNL